MAKRDEFIYVTDLQKKIIDSCVMPKRIDQMVVDVKRPGSVIARVVRSLVNLGHIVEEGPRFRSISKNYVIAPLQDVSKFNTATGPILYEIVPIKPYKPTKEIKEEVMRLHKKKMKRSEIARELNLTRSQVLWTIMTEVDVNDEIENCEIG